MRFISITASNRQVLDALAGYQGRHKLFDQGLEELNTVTRYLSAFGVPEENFAVDLTIARGLDYYTGTVYETTLLDHPEIGSVCSGGRYDNLTGVFGMPGLSGVGISFGADRIYDVMNQLNLYPKEIESSIKVMFINFGEREALQALKYVKALRLAGIPSQVYPDAAKMKKQMSTADADKVPFVAFVGEQELIDGNIMLKDMASGEQSKVTIDELIARLSDGNNN